ncbi:MAG: tRNA lysidine(34) synthetase TilS, partial [Chromatiales bacterium]|nr:tRNA lysidine(34) synthetase TilS [Chromatiales bacterium]
MTAREPLMSKVRAQWPQAAPNAVVWIAYSGGADSTALLALAAELRDEGLITDLRAVHVHHGLSPQADVWGEHCLAVANRLGVVLEIKRIDVTEYKEGGLEAAAREGRYKAIQQVMDKDDVVVTAHHLQDQAETVLLRLFRGAGVEGLVGMSKRRSFGPGWLVRPLLGISQDEMANWLRGTPLPWIEDPMNVDEHLDRVYLRKSVMPVVRRRWAAADRVIARSAAHHATAVRALRQAGYEHDR